MNYIPSDFIGMSGKTMCGYIDGIMTPEIGLFLETILCKERPKYSFGRSWTGDRLKETIIKLPVDEKGNPDWAFMKQYIKSLNHKPITTQNAGGGTYLLLLERLNYGKNINWVTYSKVYIKQRLMLKAS